MPRGLLVLLSVLALTAPAAIAQEDEVFVDPGSPSGKEYALPVDSARKQAAKDAGRRSAPGEPAPLFGEGIGDATAAPPSGASSTGAAAGRTGGGSAGSAGSDRGARGGSREPQAARAGAGPGAATLRAQAASPDGGTGLAVIIGAGLGVVLLGAAAGLVLRRRSARAPADVS